jgi:hypothetical protein
MQKRDANELPRKLTYVDGLLAAEEGASMCLDCGCGEPNENHGDSRHITMDSIRSAAQASEISVDEVAKNISDGVRQAQQTSDQTAAGSAASG